LNRIQFPFLIGTVRTWGKIADGIPSSGSFPFLIGTVRTPATTGIVLKNIIVSIPHRYGKNVIMKLVDVGYILFPFLIGTVRTE